MIRKRLMLLAVLGIPTAAFGYEIGIHAYVTQAAVDASVLSPTHPKSIVTMLGFSRLDSNKPFELRSEGDTPIGYYFDDSPHATIPIASEDAFNQFLRKLQNIEGNIFERLRGGGYLAGAPSRQDFEQRIDAWVMRGAIREDDNDVGAYSIGDRDDDPWNKVFRAGRHFYDPINNRALDSDATCFTFGCKPAIEWALGRTGVLAGPGGLDTRRENRFSWQDARDNYWWALTYNLTNELGMGTHGEAQEIESGFRSLRFATALKSVGQVIHLLQDAAQPQHVRNDSHGPPVGSLVTPDLPADGAFEAFTELRLFGEAQAAGYFNSLTHFDGTPLNLLDIPRPNLRGNVAYPIPSFSKAVEFFTTQIDNVPVAGRRGLADLSNRGFFTASTLPVNVETGKPDLLATAFADPPRPDVNGTFFQEVEISTPLYYQSTTVTKERVLLAAVPDVLAPSWNQQSGLFALYSNNGLMPLLAVSQAALADDFLVGAQPPGVASARYTMSYSVFEAQADAMLPRAVAYSTGLINYFFRGRLEITPNIKGCLPCSIRASHIPLMPRAIRASRTTASSVSRKFA